MHDENKEETYCIVSLDSWLTVSRVDYESRANRPPKKAYFWTWFAGGMRLIHSCGFRSICIPATTTPRAWIQAS